MTTPPGGNAGSIRESSQAEALRGELVDALIAHGDVTSWEIKSAMRTVPRHRPDPTGGGSVELGVHAYGPGRELLAARLADRIRAWDRGGHRGSVEPTVRAYPLTTPDDQLAPGQAITNRYSRLVVSLPWPADYLFIHEGDAA